MKKALSIEDGATKEGRRANMHNDLHDEGTVHGWGLSFQVYWLPPNASWLDQIEIGFSILQRKLLQPNRFASVTVLEQAIAKFIARYVISDRVC